jgi:hypothetical protein
MQTRRCTLVPCIIKNSIMLLEEHSKACAEAAVSSHKSVSYFKPDE